MSFVVFSGVFDVVVIDGATRIYAPFGGSRYFCLFRGDNNNTIGTSCSVKSIRCGIFQYGDRFYIRRVDIVPTSFIRHAVDNNQRVDISIDRTYASYDKGWRTSARLSGTSCHL